MTTTPPLDLDEIEARAAALYEYATVTDQEGQGALDTLTDTDVPALLAALRDSRAELERERENYQAYRIGAEGAKAIAVKRIEDLDRALGETIDDRDQAHEIADKLAYTVAPEEVIGEHSSMNCPWANALDLITPAAEVDKLRARVAELEGPAVEARAALAALCYDLEDPGSNAFGALYLISQATVGVEAPKDDAALALGQHASEVLHRAADLADPEEPEVSFFGPTFGPQVAGWLRMIADRPARPAAVAAAGDTDGTNA